MDLTRWFNKYLIHNLVWGIYHNDLKFKMSYLTFEYFNIVSTVGVRTCAM